MKNLIYVVMVVLLTGTAAPSVANKTIEKETIMSAKGKFEIKLVPQEDDTAPAGRLIINKSYTGGLVGSGIGQMISKRTESGSAVYFAIEEFVGTVNGKKGAFTLVHKGAMNKESLSLDVMILEGSGSGELTNIKGKMEIVQEGGVHNYELKYTL